MDTDTADSPQAHVRLPATMPASAPGSAPGGPRAGKLELRGRLWLILSFAACPCHLPLTLGFLVAVLGGTALGAAIRDNAVVAGAVIAAVWVAGTARGFWLIRRGQRDGYACEVPT